MLNQLGINNIKSFRKFDVSFKEGINVITKSDISGNPVGCSNLTSIFNLIGYVLTGAFSNYLEKAKAHNLMWCGVSHSQVGSIHFQFTNDNGTNNEYSLTLTRDRDNLMLSEEMSYLKQVSNKPEKYKFKPLQYESQLHHINSKLAKCTLRHLSNMQYYSPNFNDESSIRYSSRESRGKSIVLRSNFSNLAEYINLINKTSPGYLDRINSILLNECGIILTPEWRNDKICLNTVIKNCPAKYVTPYYLTNTQLKYIALVSLLCNDYEYQPETIVIEDIDQGLTKSQKHDIVDLLIDASRNCQFIINASQSFVELLKAKSTPNVIELKWDTENFCTKLLHTHMDESNEIVQE
jgi:hypothetical protein